MMRNMLSASLAAASTVILSTGTALAGPSAIEVPEPASLALLAAAVGGAAWLKFRRKR